MIMRIGNLEGKLRAIDEQLKTLEPSRFSTRYDETWASNHSPPIPIKAISERRNASPNENDDIEDGRRKRGITERFGPNCGGLVF
jgi:hypothetical protein